MLNEIRILILEDVPTDAELIQLELRRAGLPIVATVVEGREEFVKGLTEFDPHLVLSDKSLPRMDGITALHLTRELHPDLPFILVSGSVGEEKAIELLTGGATDYVLKDRISRLVPAVRRALQEAEVRAEHRKAEEALRESEERYALAVLGANDGIYDWDLRANRVYCSERWGAIVGVEGAQARTAPQEWLGRIHPDDAPRVKAQLDLHLEVGTPHFESEHRVRREDGTYRWLLVRGLALRDENGKAYRMAGSMTDITDRKRAEEQGAYNAFYDRLTGLPNRMLFIDRLERRLQFASRRRRRRFAVLLLDLDRFKVINDSLGHTAGDGLLTEAARKLERCVRSGDTVARVGGDEFAILLDEVESLDGATDVAQQIHRELLAPVTLEDTQIATTTSIGLVLSHGGYVRAEEVFRDADTALYRAKSLGRSRTMIFESSMGASAQALMRTESELGRALERREFVLFYQPILALATGVITGCEALVRWMHPDRGLVMPGQFIPVAEETGAIVPIGVWALREACARGRFWADLWGSESSPVVSVNLSARQFRQPDLYETIARTMEETGLPPDRLKLEVTESAVMDDAEEAARILRRLEDLGIRFALDDFGTGYSSLSYLQRFPFSTLKIDRSFVRDVPANQDASAIATAVINLAHSLKMDVVAEGIELDAQNVFLRSLQCDAGQGYLFGKPMPPDAIELLMAGHLTAKWQ